jgi:prevent-host-death family protein
VSKQVNIYEAKSQLSRLVDEVEAGGEVVIARAGKPVARLVPLQRSPLRRTPGAWKGKVWMAPDFDETDEELIDLFYNGPVFPEDDEHDEGGER